MIEELRGELAPLLPLKIKEAVYADPTLTLAGDGWAFSSPSAWRMINSAVLDFGWSSADAPDLVWDLVGLSIVSVDPWSMLLPNITLVGSPSAP